jgi:pyridoxal phosphate enzyme (YggS family)
MTTTDTIASNLAAVRERIARAAARAGRAPESVRLVAVTKTVEPARVQAAVAAGVLELGENYVQEARAKVPEVSPPEDAGLIWHMIGHLQSNKAKYSVGLFSLIQSVDNYQLAQELGKQATKKGKSQPVLIEVNLAGAEHRAGVLPAALPDLVKGVLAVPGLELQGLMGMAPAGGDPEAARPHFRRLRGCWEALPGPNRRVLSMGMSADFEVAIEEGATLVRIGTALFGRRVVSGVGPQGG